MNKETKIITIASIIAAVNIALIAFDIFNGLIYVSASVIAMFVMWSIALYHNNDFTPEACQGTGLTRLLKLNKKGATGENFFNDVDEVDDMEEGEANA